ncbi:alkylhydroperoxidase [Saccharothrix sp. NRRL B-16348]|uniref:carboxymuconolactone decarboxylase family protein n=1 Tax=Saccharothrix sp. NRRL B-16348 TaxID=1415542 RepID=UPI0006AF50DD|nr:carboxymuconolactone decarboxylase family protein [Saccharothrix sp. NRRL B-16348]KOX17923.1 alkylhydroperoxidase [Saccharothrix sp. NRRL B-16348]
MEARMNHPVTVLPGTMKALLALGETATQAGLPQSLMELVNLRASQINGCGVCVDMHGKALRKAGESDERIFAVGAWRDTPYYTEAERAALALAEAVTRLADRPDPVSDEVWQEAAKHYDEQQLSALLVAVATVNVWNRLNASTKQVAGTWG